MTNSIYEILTKLGTPIAKTKIIDQFDGSVLTNLWTKTTSFGTFTVSMQDAIDEGLDLSSSTGGNQGGYIDFNSIRNYSNNSSGHIAVWKRLGSFSAYAGFWSNSSEADVAYWRNAPTSDSFFTLVTTGSSVTTANPSTLAIDTNWHVLSMILGSSNVVGLIDGANTTTNTSNLPTAKLQPVFKTTTNITPAAEIRIRYFEAYNI